MKDLLSLTRPKVTALVIFTSTAGILMAPGRLSPLRIMVIVLAISAIAGACSCFNMFIERRLDGLMKRTQTRPIPSGRLRPVSAILFGAFLLALGFPALIVVSEPLSPMLGALAVLLYIGVYTPLKTRSHSALYIGAVSGALPILMGYTAVTGRIDGKGLILFAILYAWQLPHFLAISLVHADDYRKAGIRVYPVVFGRDRTRRYLVLFGLILWLMTLMPLSIDGIGPLYVSMATLSGLGFLVAGLRSLGQTKHPDLDRNYFLGTLGQVPLLLITLLVDALL
jgi:protoheme IX farnesyltransferase